MGIDFLDIPKIGYIIATRYEHKKKFNFFSEGIYQRQLWADFDNDDALYTHVAISSGGPDLVNVMPPKAKWIKLGKVYGGTYIKILKYKRKDFDVKRYKVAVLYNALASNLRYDWFGVLGFIIPGLKQVASRVFCSEACCEAYQRVYPEFFKYGNSAKCMPAFFVNKNDFDIVWEGYVTDNKVSFR